jgi:hypothetical protein
MYRANVARGKMERSKNKKHKNSRKKEKDSEWNNNKCKTERAVTVLTWSEMPQGQCCVQCGQAAKQFCMFGRSY